jgi:hypothetical protein
MKLVLVEWIDPWAIEGWEDTESALAQIDEHVDSVSTVGWVVAETEDYLAIASSITSAVHPQLGNILRLPRRVINNITELTA